MTQTVLRIVQNLASVMRNVLNISPSVFKHTILIVAIILTFSGLAYFEKKLNIQVFQLFENDLFLSNLLKSEHQKAFKV